MNDEQILQALVVYTVRKYGPMHRTKVFDYVERLTKDEEFEAIEQYLPMVSKEMG